jgi:preprotein translocase subunit YajC
MSSEILHVLSAAGAAGAAPPAWLQFMPLVAMGFIFWFLILRPQMRKQKEHQTKIASLKRGDQVLTAGGFIGKVVKVDEHYAEIELAPNVKVKAVKSTISDIVDPTAKPAAND